MQRASYFCGSLILAAFFWGAALFRVSSSPPSTHLYLGLLVIVVCAYLAALMAAHLFSVAMTAQYAPKSRTVFGRGSMAFVVWLVGGWMLRRAFTS